MRFVQRAEVRPSRCAVLPTISGDHAEGFIDTGSELPGFDNHVYVSVVAVREMCRVLGWPDPAEVAALLVELEDARNRVRLVEAELVEANREIDAVYVLKSKNWTPAKKPGRPPKMKEAA